MPSLLSAEPSPESHLSNGKVPDAEPGPDWPLAKQLWGIAWEFHWAGFGVLFSILAVRSILALGHVQTRQGFARKPLFIAINALLLTLGATRALCLFLDPYSSGDKIPAWISKFLFGIAFPCLTSSFCLIHLAFVEVTKIQIGSKKLQSARFLGGIITTHFALETMATIATAINRRYSPSLIVCQSFFIIWASLLSAAFIYSGLKVIRRAEDTQKQLETFELRESAIRATRQRRKGRTSKVAKITLATSILGFAICGLQLYSMFGVYGLYNEDVSPSPWPWWVFQTCSRLVELCMACTIAYSVTQPSEPQNMKK